MSGCGCEVPAESGDQKRVLVWLLLINFTMFFVEILFGIVAQSTALIADSIDMLADAAVYVIALYAVGRSALTKARVAHLSGVLQVLIGVSVMGDVVRRVMEGYEPQSMLMFVIGLLALSANVVCLKLISKHRDGEVHMRASWIFSKNDVIANIGVIVAALIVYLTGAYWADLFIGVAIALLVIKGGFNIIQQARREKHNVCQNNQ